MEAYVQTRILHHTHHPEKAERHTRWVWTRYLSEFKNERPLASITRKEVNVSFTRGWG
jgi:hypothetical protein